MKHLICILLAGLGTLCMASEKLTIADLSEPKHPTYTLTDISIEEAEYATGEPSRGRKVIIEKNGKLSWSGKSIGQIDREHGGDGHPEIKLHMGERKVIELFKQPRGTITPKSGRWKTTQLSPQIVGACGNMPVPSTSWLAKYYTIRQPFHPDQIIDPSRTKLPSQKWKRITPNRWEAPALSTHQGSFLNMQTIWRFEILSRTKMRLILKGHIRMNIPSAGLNRECSIVNRMLLNYNK